MGILILTLVSLTACLSCSRIEVETTPFGGKTYRVDSQKNAARVNAWPLFYHMGENTSVLWPLYQQSAKGHQLFPVYSYQKEPEWLNMALGVLSEFDYKNQDYRVLNVGWDEKEKEMWAFPLFYHQQNDPDKPATWITPLYSQGADFFNVGGVLFHSSKSPTRRAMWAAAGMFYDQARVDGSSHTNRLFPFWSYKRRGLAGMSKEMDLNVGLVAYVQYTEDDGNQAYRSVLFPLTHCWTSDREKGSAIFPLYYDQQTTSGDHTRVTPLSLSYKEGKKSWDSIGWLFHFWSLDRSTGHMFLPFYSYVALKGDGHRFNSLLYNEERSAEKKLTNVGGPIFYTSNKSGDTYRTLLWPFFQQWCADQNQSRTDVLFPFFLFSKKGEREMTLFPLGGWWKEGDIHGSWLFPLYAAKSGLRESYVFTLPYETGKYLTKDPKFDRYWKSVGGSLIGYFERQGEERRYRSLLGAIGHNSNSEKKTFSTWVFPIFEVTERRFESLLFDCWNDLPSPQEFDKVMAEAREKAKSEERYSSQSYSKGWGAIIAGYRKSTTVRSGTPIPSIKVKDQPDKISSERSADVLVEHSVNSYLFPLWESEKTEGVYSESKVLPFGALWKSETRWIPNQGTTDKQVETRFLWHWVDYENVKDKTSVDVFPFVTWDKDVERDYRSFSFLGPVCRKSRLKDRSQWQVFGFKMGDDLEQK